MSGCTESSKSKIEFDERTFYVNKSNSIVEELVLKTDSILNLDKLKKIACKELEVNLGDDSLNITFFVNDTTQYYLQPFYEVFLQNVNSETDKIISLKLKNQNLSYTKIINFHDTVMIETALNFGNENWLNLKSPINKHESQVTKILNKNVLGYAFNNNDSIKIQMYLSYDTVYIELPLRDDIEFLEEDRNLFHYSANTLKDSLFNNYKIAFLLLDKKHSVKHTLTNNDKIYVFK